MEYPSLFGLVLFHERLHSVPNTFTRLPSTSPFSAPSTSNVLFPARTFLQILSEKTKGCSRVDLSMLAQGPGQLPRGTRENMLFFDGMVHL
jgi:hypothetical protein